MATQELVAADMHCSAHSWYKKGMYKLYNNVTMYMKLALNHTQVVVVY